MSRALAAVALCLAACGPAPADRPRVAGSVEPQRPGTVEAPAAAAPPDAQTFASQAAGLDAFELQAARAALGQASDPRVREFAGLMIRDHQASTAKLQKAVAEAMRPLSASAAPTPAQPAPGPAGADFDLAYVEGQVAAHEQALRLLRAYAERGDEPSLVAYASETAGAVRQHHDHARRLREQLRSR